MSRYGQRTELANATLSNWGKASTGIGVVGVYGVATGGTSYSITVSSITYTLLVFTSDANLVVSTGGLFDVLMVGVAVVLGQFEVAGAVAVESLGYKQPKQFIYLRRHTR